MTVSARLLQMVAAPEARIRAFAPRRGGSCVGEPFRLITLRKWKRRSGLQRRSAPKWVGRRLEVRPEDKRSPQVPTDGGYSELFECPAISRAYPSANRHMVFGLGCAYHALWAGYM